MKFAIHRLELHRDIVLPADGNASDGTSALFEYRSDVADRDLEPDPARHLTDGACVSLLPAGTYFFAQGLLGNGAGNTTPNARALPDAGTELHFREAAEAIWLEAIWRDIPLKKNRTFVRVLSEDSKTVFQVFREL